MDASYQSLLANRLAPALASAGLETELWAYDHNTDRPDYPQSVLDNTTRATVNTVAWHCYAPGDPDTVWAPLRNFASRNPGVRQVSMVIVERLRRPAACALATSHSRAKRCPGFLLPLSLFLFSKHMVFTWKGDDGVLDSRELLRVFFSTIMSLNACKQLCVRP